MNRRATKGWPNDARFAASLAELRRRVESEPGVTGVAFVDRLPPIYHRERLFELRRSAAIVLLLPVFVHLHGCGSDEYERVAISLRNTDTYEYPTVGGDEEGAVISRQARSRLSVVDSSAWLEFDGLPGVRYFPKATP